MVEETEYNNIFNIAVIDLNNNINIVADTTGSDNHHAKRNEGHESYHRNNVRATVFKQDLNDAYEKLNILNLFILPSGATGEKKEIIKDIKDIKEITCLSKLWIQDSLLKTTALKAIHLKLWIQVLLLKTIKVIYVISETY